jgi:hypothetical protein
MRNAEWTMMMNAQCRIDNDHHPLDFAVITVL